MAKNSTAENDWVHSVLKRQNLLEPSGGNIVDLKLSWAQIEECQIVERLGEMVADINRAAGYSMLELQDYLPPQTTVVRIVFSKWHAEYVLEIIARERGAAEVVFYSLGKISELWRSYFRSQSQSVNPSISLELNIHPAEILSDDLQSWFSYLVSGFKNRLKPNAPRQLSGSEQLESRNAVRKKSA
jgi:hypothetical protein